MGMRACNKPAERQARVPAFGGRRPSAIAHSGLDGRPKSARCSGLRIFQSGNRNNRVIFLTRPPLIRLNPAIRRNRTVNAPSPRVDVDVPAQGPSWSKDIWWRAEKTKRARPPAAHRYGTPNSIAEAVCLDETILSTLSAQLSDCRLRRKSDSSAGILSQPMCNFPLPNTAGRDLGK